MTDTRTYNEMYLHDDRTSDDLATSPYLPMYRAVVAEVKGRGLKRVLEVGCVSGTLASMIIGETGSESYGFDFAQEGVKRARACNAAGGLFFVGDAT